ncbi:predicted protein [Histoplasma capsulatum G186AR]|uniref:Uncharacterized protein n=1 Tax=Ajellomyces capsulatus (strain G186AR / H82 / ATCC MYA-2454 / RMSCC 2432) TaxID=447093 RepID=C0NCJ7_AJECG|nr:uncharacterized protein HCBG_00843 [Histoplasma capsulatum G186AR]EEH11388.1 predicted protein [Histoplasma capsulatum G186AR]
MAVGPAPRDIPDFKAGEQGGKTYAVKAGKAGKSPPGWHLASDPLQIGGINKTVWAQRRLPASFPNWNGMIRYSKNIVVELCFAPMLVTSSYRASGGNPGYMGLSGTAAGYPKNNTGGGEGGEMEVPVILLILDG